ncbi:tyrosine-type recombinase/integrase [Marilutibacter aestuarii]|uniref:DUF4102 domain-containing protein n=1 Tax=Marilutibacter aestuarii TaxID=1706195 RepID=A0A508ACS7_9GAMM|nr:site-specific integrase [Lysobacter aestuarii]TQD47666.1 DUF4102 domain-containing protein [Lysobacter aestuarii]
MAQTPKLPPAVEAKAKRGPGRYGVGDGLYLHVRQNGARGWVFRYRDRSTGRQRDKGLGTFPEITLATARAMALELRRDLLLGKDPIDSARQELETRRLEEARSKTFGACCTAYIHAHKAGWRNAKHGDQWRNTLDAYAATLLPLPVQQIDTAMVVAALEPIWSSKTETATRVRQRMEAVLDWATARGYRAGENPARWRGHLDKLLPPPLKLKRVAHRAALPYPDVPEFMATLALKDTLASTALRLQILTATRPGEAVAAEWSEFDMDSAIWTIPAERMKASKPHRVPLSPSAMKLLRALPAASERFLFPGKPGRHITTAATLKLVQEVKPGLTAHGFRSSFRDWAADMTSYPRDVAEAALAHTIKDKTEAAYRRTDMLERRGRLMADWARFCSTSGMTGGKVSPIRKPSSAHA